VEVAVAGALVTAAAGQHRHDLVAETDQRVGRRGAGQERQGPAREQGGSGAGGGMHDFGFGATGGGAAGRVVPNPPTLPTRVAKPPLFRERQTAASSSSTEIDSRNFGSAIRQGCLYCSSEPPVRASRWRSQWCHSPVGRSWIRTGPSRRLSRLVAYSTFISL